MSKLTRKGARHLTAMLDEVATVVQENHQVLGVNSRIAQDFAYRCDLLSDAVETLAVNNFPRQASEKEEGEEEVEGEATESKKASVARRAGFDASTIGEEVTGPIETLDSDEPWMGGHFTQDKFQELRGAQQAGVLGVKPYFSPNAKKAALDNIVAARNPQELAKAARQLRAALDTLPGLSKMQMEQKVDELLELEKQIAEVNALYAEVFKRLSGLKKEQEAGLDILKKAAAQVHAKGKTVVETRNGIIEFVAKMSSSTPGLEQIMMNPSDAKPGERAGDLLGRLIAELDAEVAAKCVEIILQTKKDLTYSKQICYGLKVVAKTATISPSITKQAGLAEIVVSVKDWLAGQADNLSQKILGVVGDVTRFFKTCLERTKIVQKAGDDVQNLLDNASAQIDKMAMGKKASLRSTWLTEE